jgi:small subunit ribosomal protein S17
MMMIEQKKSGRTITVVGKVISNKMQKTIVVKIDRKVKHPLVGKYIKRSSKMYAHVAENTCQIGDVVRIKQVRPLSKKKNWVLLEVLDKSDGERIE